MYVHRANRDERGPGPSPAAAPGRSVGPQRLALAAGPAARLRAPRLQAFESAPRWAPGQQHFASAGPGLGAGRLLPP